MTGPSDASARTVLNPAWIPRRALAREGHPTGPSLRVLEVFGSPETYASGGRISGDSATALCPWLQQLWLHLAQRCHFYPQLRRLLATRVPDPGPKEEGTPQVGSRRPFTFGVEDRPEF